ncbi:GNAT family N-acetyltransferase [Kordia sp. YSTF-M3]|uniref:GNAT family N-acetyltransferase n=1 Tax=Kordia aestuariivivens TaxID=2759037 RepID=A0ABR7QB19_9FLAO|nr:GNAT family protein [Kordia aestuariivivens]MBC8755770.1 GNAT family N-acetyltransferase [Kordia aestuariivivens]
MILKIDDTIELKSLAQSDALAIFNTIDSQRIYLGKWLPFVALTKELADTENFINSVLNTPKEKLEFVFTIRKHDEFVGLIGLKNTDTLNKKTEIGYWLSEKSQGQGIITKSVAKLCDFIFNELHLNRIEIKCAIGNEPSIGIPKRLGCTFEGIERQGEWIKDDLYHDLEVYSKLKSDVFAK